MPPTTETTQFGLLTEIRNTSLPDELDSLFTQYDDVVGTRDRFLWKWIDQTSDVVTLSSVSETHREHLRAQKLRIALFITIVDDFADRDYAPELLHAASALPLADTVPSVDASADERRQLQLVADVWASLRGKLPDAPRYNEFRTTFRNDVLEACKANEYGDLHDVDPETSYYEYSIQYESPVMLLRPLATLDLMYSRNFEWRDFPVVRRATSVAQPMFRIGNWLTTWEREFAEGDYANGVIACAIDEGVVTVEEVRRLHESDDDPFEQSIADRIRQADMEEMLRDDWHTRFDVVTAQDWQAESVDVEAYLTSMQDVFAYQKAGRGVK